MGGNLYFNQRPALTAPLALNLYPPRSACSPRTARTRHEAALILRTVHPSRPTDHHSHAGNHASRITAHQSLLTDHAFLIASHQLLEFRLIPSQQTRKHFLIPSFYSCLASAPHLSVRSRGIRMGRRKAAEVASHSSARVFLGTPFSRMASYLMPVARKAVRQRQRRPHAY
jgi:hypothetical protein